jgi:predicted DCC family thiol-disulfide oxidoreductase YuxK
LKAQSISNASIMSSQTTSGDQPLVVFHDGACPLCQAEVMMLRHNDTDASIEFIDIHSECFDRESNGVTRDQALRALHGRIGNGRTLQGIDVFAEAYRRAGFSLAHGFMQRRWLRPVFEAGYRFFATNRKTISRLVGPAALKMMRRRYRNTSSRSASQGSG